MRAVFYGLCFSLVVQANPSAASVDTRPNILFVLADDLGIQDLGAFRLPLETQGVDDKGSAQTDTPHIDRLAMDGLRFTRFYSDSSCAVSRAGILTGRYPVSLGFRPSGRGISPEILTLPEALRSSGYRTVHIGKWHLGYRSESAWPLQQGYDEFFGFLNQFLLRSAPGVPRLARPGYENPFLQNGNAMRRRYNGHLSELLLAETERALDRLGAQASPWFLSVWPYLPHEPLQPAAEFSQRFADSPAGRYRAMLAMLDAAVGRIVRSLEKRGLLENTVLVFASDNGGTNRHQLSNGPLPGEKGWLTEGGLRVPMFVRYPAAQEGGEDREGDGGIGDTQSSEAGKREKSGVRYDPASYLDLMPTILGLAGVSPPEGLPGRNLLLESRPQEPLFWSSGVAKNKSWSMLTGDGRWRYSESRFSPDGSQLRILPDGTVESLTTPDPGLRQTARRAYAQWAARQRRVPVARSPRDPTGQSRLRGADFQRAPGGTAQTISLCLSALPRSASGTAKGANGTNEPTGRKAEKPQDEEWIASQPGQWSLRRRGQTLEWAVAGLTLKARMPDQERGRLSLVSHFETALAFPGLRSAELAMYWDQQSLGSVHSKVFRLSDDGLHADTLLGMGPEGESAFAGTIGNVAIWNDLPPAALAGAQGTAASMSSPLASQAWNAWHEWSAGFSCDD